MPGFNKSGGSSGPSPSASVTSETAFGQAAAVGVSVDYSRGDHTHGTPASPIPAHEAAGDPHPAYALDSDLSTHAAAPDPHPAYALDSDLSAHAAAADPHPNYALDSDLTAHATAADPHAVYQLESEKGAVNGYAGLGADSFVPTAQLGSGTPDTTKFLRGDKSWVSPTASAAWGSITGTLSAQTDLQTALDGKSATGHNHDATYQALSGKNAASGYAGLDASSKLTGSQQVYGTGVNTACQGNDSRLSDARTPTAHAVSHETGGADAVKLDELAAPTDITTLNASITAHGLLPKLSNNAAQYLNGVGGWTTPGGGSDPWTYVTLAADFTTTSATAVDVTGLAFTPAANTKYEFEAVLLTRTATATVGPRPGLAWPTGMTDGVARIKQTSSATAELTTNGNINAALLCAVGGLPTNTQSYPADIKGVVIAGASPSGTVKVQLASETAGTTVTIKAGSFIRYRSYT